MRFLAAWTLVVCASGCSTVIEQLRGLLFNPHRGGLQHKVLQAGLLLDRRVGTRRRVRHHLLDEEGGDQDHIERGSLRSPCTWR